VLKKLKGWFNRKKDINRKEKRKRIEAKGLEKMIL
jgi:hypothetical protein